MNKRPRDDDCGQQHLCVRAVRQRLEREKASRSSEAAGLQDREGGEKRHRGPAAYGGEAEYWKSVALQALGELREARRIIDWGALQLRSAECGPAPFGPRREVLVG